MTASPGSDPSASAMALSDAVSSAIESMTDEDPSVRVGDVIDGKYKVERVLGRGGMGMVLAAEHLQLRERVALKFMNAEAMKNPEAVGRFIREARAAVKLKGEHVCRVLDMGQTESGSRYIVIEYLDGKDLHQILRTLGKLEVETAVEYILQACDAMAEAHAVGIVHRDIKPGNLFLTRGADGAACVKVLDFGISKYVGPGTQEIETQTRALMGSPLYMSPEQLVSAKDVDARSDIWALGTVLFQLVHGRTPFTGESLPSVIAQVMTGEMPDLRAMAPDLPPTLHAIIERCLQHKPDHRYPSVAELAADLAALLPNRTHLARRSAAVLRRATTSSPVVATAPSVVTAHEEEPRRRIGLIAGVAAVTIAAGIAIVIGIGGGDKDNTPVPAPAPATPASAATPSVDDTETAPAAAAAVDAGLEFEDELPPLVVDVPASKKRSSRASRRDRKSKSDRKTSTEPDKSSAKSAGDLLEPGTAPKKKKPRKKKPVKKKSKFDGDMLDPS